MALPATPAPATTVSFSGVVANLCVLTLTTPGLMGVSNDGTLLSSRESGGLKAVLAVVATGTNPQLSFSAPQLTGPSASTSSATTLLGYTSLGGGNRALSGGASSFTANRLLDTVTIDGAALNSTGFVTGTYTLSSTVTCQQ
ncbi:hypothetical protein ABC347_08615 [Sphingomonas sp. 1P06PA]|uniref:hypothetical protein n=1 Tax=Sphingomonas sp. 1P06PA TaxID=554121 RepID=UPI0039A72087